MTDILELLAPDEPTAVRSSQWKLCRIQMVNWGTFEGYHQIRISAFGHLITGESGKGKSTALDVVPAVMVPPLQHDFNGAARDAATRGRDRDVFTYVRGAYAQQLDESGKPTVKYLREKSHWSAVSMTFHHPDLGDLALVRVFRVSDTAQNAEAMSRAAMIVERDFDLKIELEPLVRQRLDVGVLRRNLLPLHASTDFTSFQERYMRKLGLSERSLQLLQKIQAMKGLNDLGTLMRDFMLDEPATFRYRDEAVANFRDLSAVHQSVVDARDQLAMLLPIRGHAETLDTSAQRALSLRAERAGLDRLHVELRADIFTRELAEADGALTVAKSHLDAAETALARLEGRTRDLQREYDAAGGSDVRAIEAKIEAAEEDLQRTEEARRSLSTLLASTGHRLPEDQVEFDSMVAAAGADLDNSLVETKTTKDARDAAAAVVVEARKALADAVREKESLERRGASNVGDREDTLRNEIAAAIGVTPDRVPFAAELIEVRPEDKGWQGPIERALGAFASSILVTDDLYREVNDYVTDTYLDHRMVRYIRADTDTVPVHLQAAADSILGKLDVAPGPLHDWVTNRLQQNFDYRCVDSLNGLPREVKAITRTGLIRNTGNLHVKDDRSRVNDRRNWILGFDSSAKVAEYRALEEERQGALESALDARNQLDEAEAARAERRTTLARILDVRWSEINTSEAAEKVEQLHRAKQMLQDERTGLQRMEAELVELRDRASIARETRGNANNVYGAAEKTAADLSLFVAEEQSRLAASEPLDPVVANALGHRVGNLASTTIRNLDDSVRAARDDLDAEVTAVNEAGESAGRSMLRVFGQFKGIWKDLSADVDDTFASLPDFLAILQRIEDDGLPRFEQKFLDMMQEGAYKHLTDLYRSFDEERVAIHRRIDPINRVLETTEYNTGTTLEIEVNDVPPTAVIEFKRKLQAFTEMSVYAAPETAEQRYEMLAEIMGLLDGDDVRWQREVLDCRRHVDFVAKEMREGVPVDWFTSSNGRSGGQRVKFVTFTLAAALKYQLTDDLHDLPVFAPVVIDEAFSKADADFTRQSLRVFKAFGFQLILATPNKMLTTFQEFVGAATVVHRSDETQHSTVKTVTIEDGNGELASPGLYAEPNESLGELDGWQ